MYVQIYCKRRFTAILVAILVTPVLFTKIRLEIHIICKCWLQKLEFKMRNKNLNIFAVLIQSVHNKGATKRVKMVLRLFCGCSKSVDKCKFVSLQWFNDVMDLKIWTLIKCILVFFKVNFQGYIYFSYENMRNCLNNFWTTLVYKESKVAPKANLLAFFITL